MRYEEITDKSASTFCYFDDSGFFCLPKLNQRIAPGESVALLGARGTDISSVYTCLSNFAIAKMPRKASSGKQPTIRCVTRDGNLFSTYSAYDNFRLAEKSLFPYTRAALVEICKNLRKKFSISTDFNVPIKNLSISERIIIDVIRAYISDASVFVCDNLFSLLESNARNIFLQIVEDMNAHNRSVLYLTTKWESAVQVTSRIIVFSDDTVLGETDSESVKRNPQHLIYLISGKSLMEQYDSSSQTAKMLNMLYTSAEYLTSNMELHDALSFVLKNVMQLMQCSACSIHLTDAKPDQLHLFSYPEVGNSSVLDDKFVQVCMKAGDKSSLYYSDIGDINFNQSFKSNQKGIQAVMCMPIIFKATVQGLLTAYYEHPLVYDEEQYLYLKSFCKEIAIIIETSHLMGSSVLLQESNHRIKNNLQIIISLISMQKLYAARNPDQQIGDVLDSIINRVQNIATVHEILSSKRNAGNNIDLKNILERIVDSFWSTGIDISTACSGIMIPYAKATSISMVINELVTNSVKYAFPKNSCRDRSIAITCSLDSGMLVIAVSDNGSGFDVKAVDFSNTSSIGFTIIQTIVKMDLHGEIRLNSSDRGTSAVITIPAIS